jgi:hypothetical protein
MLSSPFSTFLGEYMMTPNVQEKEDIFPSIGDSGIAQEDVNKAIDFIINEWADKYFKFMQEAQTNQKLTESRLTAEGMYIYPSNNGKYELEDIKKARLYISVSNELKDKAGDNPLKKLIKDLRSKLSDLGFKNQGEFDIRLEKGRVNGIAPGWHFDPFANSITVCWSNIKSWSTQTANMKLDKNDNYYYQEWSKFRSMISANYLNQGEAARHGFFYDANTTLHRSPVLEDLEKAEEDLEEAELDVDDYRLFIRSISI